MKTLVHSHSPIRQLISKRLEDETWLVRPSFEGKIKLPLCYPSPYSIGMSSLGYQVVYKILNQLHPIGIAAERAFLPDSVSAFQTAKIPLFTYETGSLVGQAPAILFSVAYELELTGLFTCLELSSIPVWREERKAHHPLVICGGPLTFSNPLPLGPFADIVVMGEAEEVLPRLIENLLAANWGHDSDISRQTLLQSLSQETGLWIPQIHGDQLPKVAQCDNSLLPATSAILTPHTELRSMFLIEPERGCSRGCTYCVMRRSTNGGMRLVPLEKIKSLIPEGVSRVGLVGAAVTDHPKLPQILQYIVEERGLEVGISSLRADRLTDEIVKWLSKGGYRTLTVASDGASEKLRQDIDRKTKEKHLLRAAELAKTYGMKTLKVYMMVGLPSETQDDLDELIRFTKELGKIVKTALGVAPFVAKRNTPLDGSPFAGIKEIEKRLQHMRKGLGAAAEIRPTSARWAWVEYILAQGGIDAGKRAYQAYKAGGSFAAWQKAFSGWEQTRRTLLRVL